MLQTITFYVAVTMCKYNVFLQYQNSCYCFSQWAGLNINALTPPQHQNAPQQQQQQQHEPQQQGSGVGSPQPSTSATEGTRPAHTSNATRLTQTSRKRSSDAMASSNW